MGHPSFLWLERMPLDLYRMVGTPERFGSGDKFDRHLWDKGPQPFRTIDHPALLGNYMASSFVAADDGHGGTIIHDPSTDVSGAVLAASGAH